MFDPHNDADPLPRPAAADRPEPANAAEYAAFMHWVTTHARYRQVERELVYMQVLEHEAWRKYARSARRAETTSLSDRFADAFRDLWYGGE